MQKIIDAIGKVKALEDAIVAPSPNHEDIRLMKHAGNKAFVLASIPEYMGVALDCAARATGQPVIFRSSGGQKTTANTTPMGFRLAKTGEDSGVLWAV